MAIDRRKVVQAAQKFVSKQRYDKAIIEYQRIVQEEPQDVRILLKIGDLQLKMNAHAAALETYDKVGAVYERQGFAVKAIAVYMQIRDIIAKHAPQVAGRYTHVLPKLAELYKQRGLISDALAAYDEVATAHLRGGRDKQAIEIFEKIVELDPGNPLPHLRLAEALARMKDIDRSIEQFTLAADILIQLGRRDDALKVVERLLVFKQSPPMARRAAQMYLERNGPNDGMQALAKLQIVFQSDPKNLETLGLLAQAFESIGQRPKAIEVYKEMGRLAKESGNQEVVAQVINVLQQVAPNDEALRTLQAHSRASERPAPPSVAEVELGEDEISMAEIEEIEEIEDIDLEDVPVRSEPPRPPAAPPRPPAAPPRPPAAPPRRPPPRPRAAQPEPEIREQAYDDYDAGPNSIGEVNVPSTLEIAEDFSQHDSIDPEAYTSQSLADAQAFQQARLYPKAVETLRIALEMLPASIPLREQLRDVLLEMGERDGAVGEMITLAAIAMEANDIERAGSILHEVLMLVPNHHRAREMLSDMGYAVPSADQIAPHPRFSGEQDYGGPGQTTPNLAATDAQGYEPPAHESGYGYDAGYATDAGSGGEVYDPDQPLPSYDLEELEPVPADAYAGQEGYAEQADYGEQQGYGGQPGYNEQADYGDQGYGQGPQSYGTPDAGYGNDQYADQHVDQGGFGADEPFGEAPPSSTAAPPAPLPSFALDDDEPFAELDDPYAGTGSHGERLEQPPESYSPHSQRGEDFPHAMDLDEPGQQDAGYSHLSNDGSSLDGPALELETVGEEPAELAPVGNEALEDALEEIDFFASRGLIEDARSILVEQLSRYPQHPLLLERQRDLDSRSADEDEEVQRRAISQHPGPIENAEDLDDRSFDIAASLDALDDALEEFEPTQEASPEMAGGDQVDVEAVFAKFKQGVKAQVSDADSATHYDLGVAYKEMGLIDDAITEFRVAARDPNRECVCHSMVGVIELERGNDEEAINAFIKALHAPKRTHEQELSLYYELGNIYEAKENYDEALYYFQKIQRKDPAFRDVAERIRALKPSRPASLAPRSISSEEDFDSVFDDILGGGDLP